MGRFTTFLLGVAVGGALVYTALNYHVIRTRDGMHLVPKTGSTLADTYVDVRGFGPREWTQKPALAAALVRADRSDLLEVAARDAMQTGLDRWLPTAGTDP